MSNLKFDRVAASLTLVGGDGSVIGAWNAANNVDSRSQGPWPNGTYDFDYYLPHPEDDTNSAYGSHGIFIFKVPSREGMGVHSGRASIPDGLGRRGYLHCTQGCVRTTDEATAQLVRTQGTDRLQTISIS